MSFVNPSSSLLAAAAGDSVKLFDVSVDSGDPCVLSYTPFPGSPIHSVKWNHTNFVVASAGDDNRISLWHKNGQSMGVVPISGSDNGINDIKESISSISFSNKGSRYLCSGGSSHIIRIWDLQRKRCIKWLAGHIDTVTGVMYNCKDEHLASINLKGDLIIHNLASSACTADLKDPNGQALRVLDYSRLSRHILVTAGDDGSIHLWDTTGRSPKVSWQKQHSAPTTGICFSSSTDKIIASVGLDKKLYMFDSGTRRPTFCAPYDAPFSSLAYKDDGNMLAAGTSSGSVVFYDIRGKPQPFTVLRAYSSSESIASLCWQRSKPVIVNEKNCTAEAALLGGSSEDSVLMPDPLPSLATFNAPTETAGPISRSSLTSTIGGPRTFLPSLPMAEETPQRSTQFFTGESIMTQAPRSSYSIKDDMDVFSPLADVQPITPSVSNQFDEHDETKRDNSVPIKKSSLYTNTFRKFNEGNSHSHPASEWISDSSRLENTFDFPQLSATASEHETSSSPKPPEAWGGNSFLDKLNHQLPASSAQHIPPSTSFVSGPLFSALQDLSLSSAKKSLLNSISYSSLQSTEDPKHTYTVSESSSLHYPSSVPALAGSKMAPSTSHDLPLQAPLTLPRRYTTYAERLSTNLQSDVMSSAISSPKAKKTGAETREELSSSRLVRQDTSTAVGSGILQGMPSQPHRDVGQLADQHQGTSSFLLQLVQRTLEETLGSMQKSIHEDVRNLHIELLRQFHMMEMEMASSLSPILERLDDLTKEVQFLRKENQQLRQQFL